MPFEIQQSRWDKLLRRVSGSIGPGSRVGTSISDLFPVLDVESVPGELLLLSGTRICHGSAGATGAGGEVPNVILANPVDSGLLITLTQVSVAALVNTQRIRIAIEGAISGAAQNTQRFRDSRLLSLVSFPTGQIRTFSNPSVPAQDIDFIMKPDTTDFVSDPNGLAVLAPGTQYLVASLLVTGTIVVTFWWRERTAELSELNL